MGLSKKINLQLIQRFFIGKFPFLKFKKYLVKTITGRFIAVNNDLNVC